MVPQHSLPGQAAVPQVLEGLAAPASSLPLTGHWSLPWPSGGLLAHSLLCLSPPARYLSRLPFSEASCLPLSVGLISLSPSYKWLSDFAYPSPKLRFSATLFVPLWPSDPVCSRTQPLSAALTPASLPQAPLPCTLRLLSPACPSTPAAGSGARPGGGESRAGAAPGLSHTQEAA